MNGWRKRALSATRQLSFAAVRPARPQSFRSCRAPGFAGRNTFQHYRWDFALRELTIDRANQVWCTDFTYVPMPAGHAYLCAVMDWHTRKVLGWAVSNTMDTALCLNALQQALTMTGTRPEIFNTDQGSQFTSEEWTGRLTELEIKISMDGKGRWMDNVFIERLWRSVNYEEIYLKEHATLQALRAGLKEWFTRYNEWRPHEANGVRMRPWAI